MEGTGDGVGGDGAEIGKRSGDAAGIVASAGAEFEVVAGAGEVAGDGVNQDLAAGAEPKVMVFERGKSVEPSGRIVDGRGCGNRYLMRFDYGMGVGDAQEIVADGDARGFEGGRGEFEIAGERALHGGNAVVAG